jgi:signal transduction histidine kinase
MAVLFGIYLGTAKLGLRFDALAGVATTVWPPTGIAIAAAVLAGRRVWPAIFLAALVVNASTGIPLWASLVIATGNTLEAVVAAELLRRWRFSSAMDRVHDVFLFGVVALLATTISATLGTGAIWLARIPIDDGRGLFWLVWWVGDVLGALLIAPALFAFINYRGPPGPPGRWVEAGALLVLLLLAGVAVFHDVFHSRVVLLARGTYSLWPLLIWAAVRFRQRGVSVALLVIAVVAISGTTAGHGVFAAETLHERLFRAQCYMVVTTVSIMTLAAALAERRQAILMRDEFISIASHELKTPLTALALRLRTALRLTSGSSPGAGASSAEKLTHTLQAASAVTGRLARLTDDLLDVSRLTASRMQLDLEEVKVGNLLSEVVAQLREEALESGSSVEIELDEAGNAREAGDARGAMLARWDRLRVEQVLTNLLSNAIKYGAGRPITLSARAAGESIVIAVKDAGIGISSSDRSRIFQAFERVQSAHRVGGLGLGLYIGRQIAEAHGGTLVVASELERGSTFTLELPRQARPGRGGQP